MRVMQGIGIGGRHGRPSTERQPLVIDLRDSADADVRAVCLRALHELATSASPPEQRRSA